VYRLLGLSRDPFGPACDGELYWESPSRAGVRESIEGLLAAGSGVWLSGEADSGRRTLLARAVTAVAGPHRPVAWCDLSGAEDDVLSRLARVVGPGGRGRGADLAGAVYGELVEGFCRGGPPVVFLDGGAGGDPAREELGLLSALQLVGRPLVLLALWGEGEPTVGGLERVELPALSARDVGHFLSHRLSACGRSDLFSAAKLEELAAQARGLGHALELARGELARAAFRGRVGSGGVDSSPHRVLDPSELAEVDRLLDALGPENASP